MAPSRNWLAAANALLPAILIGGSALVYDLLPADIPVHFGADGAADRFESTSWVSWMLLPAIAAALSALMVGLDRLVRDRPEWMNVRDQKRFKALSREKQLVVSRATGTMLLGIGVLTGLLFLVLQIGIFEAAVGRSDGLPAYALVAIGVFTIGTIALAIGFIAHQYSLVKQLEKE